MRWKSIYTHDFDAKKLVKVTGSGLGYVKRVIIGVWIKINFNIDILIKNLDIFGLCEYLSERNILNQVQNSLPSLYLFGIHKLFGVESD